MMQTKLFELRDSMTFIPALAVRLQTDDEREAWLLRRSGFSHEQIVEGDQFVFVHLATGKGSWDPFQMGGGTRTWPTLHRHLGEHWDSLQSGAVIDIQHILGETDTVKESEQALH